MTVEIHTHSAELRMDADETWQWAHRDGSAWPDSKLAGKSVRVAWDRNGIVDVDVADSIKALSGQSVDTMDYRELNAMCADCMAGTLPKNHRLYDVVVGQFGNTQPFTPRTITPAEAATMDDANDTCIES